MTCWVLVRLPATSYAFRHPTLARNMQGMPRMGRLAAATSSPFPCEAREKGLKTAAPSLPGQPEDPRLWRRAPNGAAIQGVESHPDGPPRMVKRPTGSGGEPSSPNCGASAGGKARQPLLFALPTAARQPSTGRTPPLGGSKPPPPFFALLRSSSLFFDLPSRVYVFAPVLARAVRISPRAGLAMLERSGIRSAPERQHGHTDIPRNKR